MKYNYSQLSNLCNQITPTFTSNNKYISPDNSIYLRNIYKRQHHNINNKFKIESNSKNKEEQCSTIN